ncbi:TPA: nonribosomal peptide synthetase/polyketide synthase [Escherichia coli]|nr:nonribosomal peptide synthetase/polyketide synthase [Salmonella enterica]EEY6056958.1 nonribosomal peptide synthetase/polyketide synthase [Escherichia coli]EGE3617182.1 nonribosomal peptide synthetase/polyketide synthase [Escherichia coli]KAA1821265.1 nonribosomal peptide synthetase/polyketide synthase [Escherichia coli]KAA1964871.1 nonribosomal peptide synthetase/polyketide synthase [Escherichia coli]
MTVFYVSRPLCDNHSAVTVTNGAIVIHTQRLKSDPGGNLLS